jgi:hypothetical protein
LIILGRARDRDYSFAEAGEAEPLSGVLKETSPLGTMIGFGTDTAAEIEAQGDFSRLARVTGAAYRAISYGENSNARALALEAGYDRIIDRAKSSTGVVLDNPERDGYGAEASSLFREEARAAIASGRNATSNGVPDVRRRLFAERLQQLADANPDKAEAFLLDPEHEGRNIAREADEELKREAARAGGATAIVGSLAGGFGAAFRDPLQVASLFVGGGAGTAVSVTGRIAQVAVREALINAGATALAQPAVQKWREEAALTSGVIPALENVGMAALVGGVFGGLIEGGREGFKALRAADRTAVEKVMDGTATPAEAETALRALGARAEDLDEFAAARREDAAAKIFSEAPPASNPHAHGDALAEAVERAETGAVLPQEPVYPVRAGVTDDAALAVLEREDLDALGALAELRRDPDLVESALSSRSPAVREAGQVALLGDEAFAVLESSGIDPRFGALVQRAASEPERQAALMRDLAELRPQNLQEAREIVGDALAADTARVTAARIGGDEIPFDPADTAAGLALPPPAPRPAARTGELLDMTPGYDEQGKAALLPRGQAELAGARDDFLNDLVKSCKD